MLQLLMTLNTFLKQIIIFQEFLMELILGAKNLESFDSLEKSSVDLYASVRSLYLQDRYRKIQNVDETTETLSDDDWEELDSQ